MMVEFVSLYLILSFSLSLALLLRQSLVYRASIWNIGWLSCVMGPVSDGTSSLHAGTIDFTLYT
jgi:hypothetical protein